MKKKTYYLYFYRNYIYIDKQGYENEYEFGIKTSETNGYIKNVFIYNSGYEHIRSIVRYAN